MAKFKFPEKKMNTPVFQVTDFNEFESKLFNFLESQLEGNESSQKKRDLFQDVQLRLASLNAYANTIISPGKEIMDLPNLEAITQTEYSSFMNNCVDSFVNSLKSRNSALDKKSEEYTEVIGELKKVVQ